MIIQRFNLNLIPNQSPVIVHVNQYDTGTGRLVATLYEGNEPYSPNGTAVIQGTKPDGHGFQYTATLDGNVVTADLTEQMSPVAGDVRAQIVVTEPSGVTGTFVFIMCVQPSALPSDTEMSESDYQYIEEAIREAQEAVQTAQEATETAQEAVERAQEAVVETAENAENSEAWAQGTRGGIPVGPTDPTYEHNAEYWAQYAERYAQGGLHYKGSIPFADIPTTGMREGDMYNITDDFTTDSRFEEGAGIEVKGGTNIAWNSDNKWDVLALPPKTTFNGRSGSILPMAGDYDSKKILLSSALHIGGETQNDVQEALEALSDDGVKFFNGRSGSILPMAGDYSAEQVNYDSNQTVKQKIDALVTKEASDIVGQQSLLKDTVGFTGKNLLKNTGKNTTSNGITTTINADKSITLNGTATSGDNACFLYGTGWGQNHYVPINETPFEVGETYIMSKGSSDETARLIFYFYNGDTYITDAKCIQKDVTFTIPQNTTHLACIARVNNGATVSNLTFYPMLRHADITDPTYEPYHESVEVMYEEEIHGINLLKNEAITQTVNGVTFTVNADKSVTVNGTATADVYLNISKSVQWAAGTYILSGGVSDNVRLYFKDNPQTKVLAWDKGDSPEFTISDSLMYNCAIYVKNGYTANNVILKPMIRKADIEDSTYRPYNPQAIQNQLNAQGVLGAKNLLPYPYYEHNKTQNGITFTDNGDGSVTVNGTATGGYATYSFSQVNTNNLSALRGEYILSSNVPIVKDLALSVRKSDNTLFSIVDGKMEVRFAVNDDLYMTGWVYLYVPKGQVVNNLTIKPMLRLASDPDDTYQPYAMTNREITGALNNVIPWTVDRTGATNASDVISDSYYIKTGRLVHFMLSVNLSSQVDFSTYPSGYYIGKVPIQSFNTFQPISVYLSGNANVLVGFIQPDKEFGIKSTATIPANTIVRISGTYICQ